MNPKTSRKARMQMKTSKGRKVHKCVICNRRVIHMDKHMLNHTGERPHKCIQCDKAFMAKSVLVKHMVIHTGKNHKCRVCDRRFTTLGTLKQHMIIHTGVKNHKCSVCAQRFGQLGNLQRHIFMAHILKRHKCRKCDKTFIQKSGLTRHMGSHIVKRPHKCHQCGKAFSHKSGLARHRMIHSKQRPHSCLLCKHRFGRLWTLKRHILMSHPGETARKVCQSDKILICKSGLTKHQVTRTGKPGTQVGKRHHRCTVCAKLLPSPSALKQHKEIHTREKPHKCSVCSKSFSRTGNFKRHMLIAHPAELPLKCTKCDKTFIRKSGLAKHVVTHREKPPKGSVCKQRSGQSGNSKRQILITPRGERHLKCSQCDMTFIQKSGLTKHMVTHTEEKHGSQVGKPHHKCPKCDELFPSPCALKQHTGVHNRIKPEKYSVGSNRSTRKRQFRDHVRKHTAENLRESSVCSNEFKESRPLTEHTSILKRKLHNHMKTHTVKKCHNSSISSNMFKQSGTLNEDMNVHERKLRNYSKTHAKENCHQCSLCSKRFKETGTFNQHMNTCTGIKPSRSDIRNKACAQSVDLEAHMQTHAATDSVCSERFGLTSHLSRHVRTRSRPHVQKQTQNEHMKPHTGAYIQQDNLNQHMKPQVGEDSCTDKRTHKCRHCGTVSQDESKPFAGEQPQKCTCCDKAVILEKELDTQMVGHTGERCYTRFDQLGNLEKRMKNHLAEKPHKCTHCKKAFFMKPVLDRHILSHKEQKYYECPVCSKTFGSSETLEQHMTSHFEPFIRKGSLNQRMKVHTEEASCMGKGTHKCWHCGTGFPDQPNLFKHITAHICFICHENFCQLEYLNEHMKTHAGADSTRCLKCGDDFISKYDLLEHRETCTDKTPDQVGKLANCVLEIKMAQPGEMLYQCSGCEKEFDDLLTACSHILNHRIKETSQNDHSLNSEDEDLLIPITVCELDKEMDV